MTELPVLRVDLSRFTTAGHGTVHGAAAVLAVRPGVADLRGAGMWPVESPSRA